MLKVMATPGFPIKILTDLKRSSLLCRCVSDKEKKVFLEGYPMMVTAKRLPTAMAIAATINSTWKENSIFFAFSLIIEGSTEKVLQWEAINCKQITRW
jgi:hypothetical protein